MSLLQSAIIVAFVGLAFITAGFIGQKKRRYLFNHGITVQGIITEISQNDEYGYALINFETNDHRQLNKRLKTSSDASNYHVGQIVKIIYDPLDYQNLIWDEGPYKPTLSGLIYLGITAIAVSIILFITAFA